MHVWDPASGAYKRSLQGHVKGVFSISFCASFRMLVTAGFEHDLLVWNLNDTRPVQRLVGHKASLIGVGVARGDTASPQIVSAATDGCIKVWDFVRWTTLQTFFCEGGDWRVPPIPPAPRDATPFRVTAFAVFDEPHFSRVVVAGGKHLLSLIHI